MKTTANLPAAVLVLLCATWGAALADTGSDALAAGLAAEKQFLLAATTGKEGEYEIGDDIYGRPLGSEIIFYIDLEQCTRDQEKCTKRGALALDAAQKFAAAYNEAIGREHIKVADKRHMSFSATFIPIRVVDERPRGSDGRFNFKSGSRTGNWTGLQIRVYLHVNRFHFVVAHEMMNATGINDTQQEVFKDCLVYDGNSSRHIRAFARFCDVEKRAVAFADKHLRPGMNISQISNAFDTHWRHSDTTLQVGEKILQANQRRRNTGQGGCKRFPNARFCKSS